MTHKLSFAARLALGLIGACSAIPALAQADPSAEDEPAISIDASVEVVSDYRFRGITLSDFDPAVQPSLTISHKSGLYLDAWGSNVAENGGADLETDVTLGWSREFGGTTVDVRAMYYAYPGASAFNYAELGASLSQAVGPGSITAEVSYAPSQANIGSVDNLYLGVSGELPVGDTALTAKGAFGYENGAFGANKLDWQLGAEYDLGKGFAAGVSYVDSYRSELREGRAGVVGNLRFEF